MNCQPYNGSVSEDVGKRRIDVWHENLRHQRMADPDELSLMLMRTTRPQQVGRDGVAVEIGGKKLYYRSDDLHTLMKQQVYVRYDPDHIGSVRVYDMEDRYLLEAPLDNTLELPYGADKEKISEAMATIRKARKVQKAALDAKKILVGDENSALNLVLRYAEGNLQTALPPVSAEAIELVRAQETPLLEAVGGETRIDMATMTRNAERRIQNEEV